MKKVLNILITDRNPHVREYLKRELMAEGYHVCTAKNGQGILLRIYSSEPLELLILDPEVLDADEVSFFEKLQDRIPDLPVVVHAFLSDYSSLTTVLNSAVFVEKSGSSVERLKCVVSDILKNECLACR